MPLHCQVFQPEQPRFVTEDADHRLRAFVLASVACAALHDADTPEARSQQQASAKLGWVWPEPIDMSDGQAQTWCMLSVGTFYNVCKKGNYTLKRSYTFNLLDDDKNQVHQIILNAGDIIKTNCWR